MALNTKTHTNITFPVKRDLHARLKRIADMEDRTLSQVVRLAVKAEAERYEKENMTNSKTELVLS